VTGNAICGTGQCTKGKYACAGGTVICVDAGKPGEEACDGVDNDCNGSVDDIETLGQSCTTLGGCPGKLACDAVEKKPVCVPDGETKLEICNGLDDDCDGSVDEKMDVDKNDDRVGKVCDERTAPNNQPPCTDGHTVCTAQGTVDCIQGVHPLKEVCDLQDNDCDGVADTLSACPGANACIDGQCDEPCRGGEFPCPGGYDCKSYDGKKYCVPQDCDDAKCPSGSHCRNNKCTRDDDPSAGGDGNVPDPTGGMPGTGDGGEPGSSMGGHGNTGSGAEPGSGGEPDTGGSASAGKIGTGNEGSEEHGAFGLVTGGGGCACRTAPSRGGEAAILGTLLMLGTLIQRRRRAREGRAA
jgi:hypothetical protein